MPGFIICVCHGFLTVASSLTRDSKRQPLYIKILSTHFTARHKFYHVFHEDDSKGSKLTPNIIMIMENGDHKVYPEHFLMNSPFVFANASTSLAIYMYLLCRGKRQLQSYGCAPRAYMLHCCTSGEAMMRQDELLKDGNDWQHYYSAANHYHLFQSKLSKQAALT